MKKTVAFLLVLCLLLAPLLSACGGGKTPTETNDSSDPAESVSSSMPDEETSALPQPQIKLERLTVGGEALSEFTIIYARNSYYKVINQFNNNTQKLIVNDYDFDRLTAERLAALLKERFGVALEVKQDSNVKTPGAHEILIGKTNRNLHTADLAADQFEVRLTTNERKLVICGGAFGTTWHAIDALEAWLEGQEAERKTAADFTAAANVAGTHHLTRIACVGDSITAGTGATDREYTSYPANLQRVLWKDAIVTNYGNGGKTMRDDLADSYYKTTTYADLIANPEPFDLVLLMLGTNDSSRDSGTWTTTADDRFITSCHHILRGIKAMSPDMKVLMMNCPKCYRSGETGVPASPHVVALQTETAKKMLQKGYSLALYDMHTMSQDKIGSANFPDSLHPNDAGYVIMANEIAAAVRAYLNGTTNSYFISLD